MALQTWLEQDLSTRFAGRILGIDSETALRWGLLRGRAEREGAPVPVLDGLIGATALHHRLTVVTRNTAHFDRLGAKIFNPWSG